jgi:hypothetical protein
VLSYMAGHSKICTARVPSNATVAQKSTRMLAPE